MSHPPDGALVGVILLVCAHVAVRSPGDSPAGVGRGAAIFALIGSTWLFLGAGGPWFILAFVPGYLIKRHAMQLSPAADAEDTAIGRQLNTLFSRETQTTQRRGPEPAADGGTREQPASDDDTPTGWPGPDEHAGKAPPHN